MEYIYQADTNYKKVAVAKSVSDKADFKKNSTFKDKERTHFLKKNQFIKKMNNVKCIVT